ncbi:sensor histidine kinase [Paenibacillus wynnii]|uniref:sensor histidine kinase n=1 Tax=Paenibacillus wynnii TaxID=268407 RepID=UPI0006916402|nr:HAMP domain-containing sensor histidine kinase [Paenibacillus wynnii]
MTIRIKSLIAFSLIFVLVSIVFIYHNTIATKQNNSILTFENKALTSALLADDIKLSVVQVQQHLTDISATRSLNSLDGGFRVANEYADLFYKDIAEFLALNPEMKIEINEIKDLFKIYHLTGEKMAQDFIDGGPAKGNLSMPAFDVYSDAINSKIDQIQKRQLALINNNMAGIIQSNRTMIHNTFVFGISVILLGIVIAYLLYRSITNPTQKLIRIAETISKGDFTKPILSQSNNEIGKLSQSFERMRENLDKLHDDRLNLIGKMASSMAHEIRNPLTSIAGFLKLIRHDINSGRQTQLQRYLDVIDDEFKAINMHITGFLSFSRNNAFEEEKVNISVTQLIHSTVYLLNPRLSNENINLLLKGGENFYFFIQKISIQQVLSNIISNAIDALISVKMDRVINIECMEDEECVQIHIKNNGPQIPKEIEDSLFLPFITHKESGTGLGLAICREIMTKNNGKIEFQSNEQETNFILSFNKS